MPGKKGFGDTRKTSSESPVYKKQGYGEGVSPFTMRSGNTTPFKQMGSSPLKQDYHEAVEHHKKYKASKKMPKNFNIKGGPSTTPGFSSTKIAKTLTKAGKFLGGKALSVAGMMMATSSKATQPGTGTHGGTKVPKLRDIDKK